MIKWIIEKWHAHQRAIDLKILWPICCEMTHDLEHAKAAFAVHAFEDEAWTCLGHEEIVAQIDALVDLTTTPGG